ncbi:MAG TPA: hypothetical protein DDW52_07385 [Planctomycetaceae bacterium]|nr:hypothetical protein [Planctomycetaceae bacterium]
MILTLIRKDFRLLRNYWRSAVIATVGCYAVNAIMITWLTHYQAVEMQSLAVRSLLILQAGSTVGNGVAVLFAALLAGSVFTLERADRSAEFLACLPPTRRDNLISKMVVVFGTTIIMFLIHIFAGVIVTYMLPYVRTTTQLLPSNGPVTLMGALSILAFAFSVAGGSLAVAAWMKSNGVPILCGLLTPILVVSFVSSSSYLLGIKSEGIALQMRMTTAAAVFGCVLTYCGCYWYLTRDEP